MSASQMNVRMDSLLKRSGDMVLSENGYTPSQAVRALWEYLTIQNSLPSVLEKLIQQDQIQHESSDSHQEVLSEGTRIISDFYTSIEIDEPFDFDITYEELQELAAQEQREKWGWDEE